MNAITDRRKKIEIIRNIKKGDSFPYFKQRFIKDTSSSYPLTDEDWKKMYISLNHLSKIIYEYMNFVPILNKFTKVKKQSKIDMLKEFLKSIEWEMLQPEIIERMETEGDVFLYWFFEDEKAKFPKIRIRPSENIKEIVRDGNGNITNYIYEETVKFETTDDRGNVMYDTKLVTWVFYKGYVKKTDSKTNQTITYYNPIEFSEYFPIFQISADKKQNDKFSEIPAERYIDSCQLLDNIDTNWNLINTLAGFPKVFLKNCRLELSMSSGSAGGVITVVPIIEGEATDIKQLEITNGLESLQKQRDIVMRHLYKMANLIMENLEEKIGSSDSARIPAQLRLPLELKIKKRIIAINNIMEEIFNIILIRNGEKNVEKIKFELPEPVIESSPFDKLLLDTQKIALGLTTIQQLLRDRGFNEEQIKQITEEINEEIINGKNDIQIQGLDNNFKTESNVKVKKEKIIDTEDDMEEI